MFRSQVIKCYELPYCTLAIFANNRFCLLIENLDPVNQSSVKLNSDRAQLTQLINTLQQQFPSTQPATPQQETQPLYPVTLPNNEQSKTTHLSWRQLCDLRKILHQYQTDLVNNNLVKAQKTKRFWGLLSLFLLLIIGGIITRVKWQLGSSTPTSTATESLLPNPNSSPQNSVDTNPSPPPSKPSQSLNLQLSDSLKPLDELSPPTSVDPPSSQDLVPSQSLPSKSNPPKPMPSQRKSKNPPSLTVPEFPSLQSKPTPKQTSPPQAETLFDQPQQVAEVRQYFQSQWKPPETLNQDLEYQLLIKANGSLQSLVPLGNASQTHLSSIPLPQANEPFVSSSPTNQKIRLVLGSNGDIQTFPLPTNARSSAFNN